MIEPLWRNGTGIERPFSALAGVSCRCSSLPLQRVMTDFGADEAFGPGAAKLKEHYGIAMPVSTVQRTTEHHAECIYEQEVARVIEPGTAAGGIFLGELDGSMVPVVEPSPEAEDQRKGKRLSKNPSLIFRKIFLWGRLPAGLASQKPTGSWFRYHIDQRLSF